MRVRGGPAGQALGHRIQVLDPRLRVDGDHGVGNGRQRDLRAVLFIEDLRFGLLAVRDVGQGPRHPLRLAFRSEHGASAGAEPPERAVPHANPELQVEGIAAAQMAAQERRGGPPVPRMDAPQERSGRLAHGARPVAHQLLEAGREVELLAPQAPVPDAVVAGDDRILEALLARAQLVLEIFPLAHQAARAQDRYQHQCDGDRDVGQHEQRAGLPRCLGQCRRKGLLERLELPVDRQHPTRQRLQVGAARLARRDRRVQCPGRRIEFGDVRIRLGPDGDGRGHEAHVPEAPEQDDHALDVFRMIAGVAKGTARTSTSASGLSSSMRAARSPSVTDISMR